MSSEVITHTTTSSAKSNQEDIVADMVRKDINQLHGIAFCCSRMYCQNSLGIMPII